MTPHAFNIYSNNNQRSLAIRAVLIDKLQYRALQVNQDPRPDADLNICIGGDGSFLRAVHSSGFSQVPFVGINTGHLGFYQEILVSEIDSFIDQFIHGEYINTELGLLSGRIAHGDSSQELFALNEFVVRTQNSTIAHMEVYVDDYHLENFAGDGLIVSTPSGSTAYNFSVGGSVLYQTMKGFQMVPIAPINSRAYRSLLNPLVMPNTTKLRLVPTPREGDNILVIADGINLDFKEIEYIEFTFGKKHINRIVFNPMWYWINIKDKFL
ncbi:MAG: NAD(+)/NADH kinase [Tissierellia bacterium]|nr:NAD(+)/NADH kinase [Tissierellia bacterium]